MIEYKHTPEHMVVLIAELKKAIELGETVELTPDALRYVVDACEDVVSVNESTIAFLLEQGHISHQMANQWKRAYRNRKEQS